MNYGCCHYSACVITSITWHMIQLCLWLRLIPELDLHEHVAMYTDDFAIAMKDTQLVVDALTEKYNFRLMGKSHIKLHLGCIFDSDDYDTFHITPETYVERMYSDSIEHYGD